MWQEKPKDTISEGSMSKQEHAAWSNSNGHWESAYNRSKSRNPHVEHFVEGEVNIWLQYCMAVLFYRTEQAVAGR